jgi:hypothetical protein
LNNGKVFALFVFLNLPLTIQSVNQILAKCSASKLFSGTGLQFSGLDEINFLNRLLNPFQDFPFGRIFFYFNLIDDVQAIWLSRANYLAPLVKQYGLRSLI